MKLTDRIKEKLKIDNLHKFNLSKKTVTNLVVLLCVGVMILIVSDFWRDLFQNDTKNPAVEGNSPLKQEDKINLDSDYKDVSKLEEQLSAILTKIQDAGEVSVMITLKSSSEMVPAKDESISDKVTNEKDTDGGTRVINELNTNDKVVFKNSQEGNSEPLIVKEINPEIKGVIVVAEGAKNPKVKLKLTQAVQTVLDVPAYRVMVYEGAN